MNAWLTEADLAELDVVALTLVDMIESHRRYCDECRDGQPCERRVEAIDAAVFWAERRALTSKAEALRARELVRGNGRRAA